MIPNHVVKCTNIMKSLNLSELQNIGVALGVAASSKIALGQLHPQFALQFSGCVVHRLHKVEDRLPLALVELGSSSILDLDEKPRLRTWKTQAGPR